MSNNEDLLTELKNSPMLYLSSGSKELFHSNFLYWLGINYRPEFEKMMNQLCGISDPWPENWEVRREHNHLDLCVIYNRETGKKRKGNPVIEECVFIIVENKVKSLPNLVQLKEYEELYQNRNTGCKYILLSLVKDSIGLEEDTLWKERHYDDLAKIVRDCFPDQNLKEEHRIYVKDYCSYIETLSKLSDSWGIDCKDPFLVDSSNLKELRLNDVYEKIRYSKIASLLAKRLDGILPVNKNGEKKVILGMSNADVIMQRGRKDADKILELYGCPKAEPFCQVFINSGMAHSIGLVEAKVKIAEDCCLVLQVQGDRYCHGVEQKGIVNQYDKLNPSHRAFIDFKVGGLKKDPDSKVCHYDSGFLYRSQKISNDCTVDDILCALTKDIVEVFDNIQAYE